MSTHPHITRRVSKALACATEPLEKRLFLSVSEVEPNDSAAAAHTLTLSSTPLIVTGTLGDPDEDFFKFTLTQRSGVFMDVDSREIGLSTSLDTILELYDGAGVAQIDSNDDGRDFDSISLNDTSNTTVPFGDSALYLDLNPGTYVIKLYTFSPATEPYQLKLTADSTYTSAVPVLSSLPGAADTLLLDFDGHSATDGWGTYSIAPFDFSGNAAEWTPAERLAIENTWRVVADHYSPFNINVTTSYAGSYTPDATAFRHVIGNSNGSEVGQLNKMGASFFDSYNSFGANYKTAFTFASNFFDHLNAGLSGNVIGNAIEIANTTSHEFGHALGLTHYGGTNPQLRGIMHSPDFGLNRERWISGMTSNAAGEPTPFFQDDLAVITKPANTFGYRADDHGNARPAATILIPSAGTYAGSGVIHQTSDVDSFRFSGSGSTSITLEIPDHLGHLDGQLYLYNAAGTLLASADPASQLGAAINFALPSAGNYYVEVRSHAGAGEIGQYALHISTTIVGGTIAGRTFRDVTLNNVYEPLAGDTVLGGVTVFLDTDNDGVLDGGETSVTSSAIDGSYAFTGLADGSYNVKTLAPAGFVKNQSYSLSISGGSTQAGKDFGNFPIIFTGTVAADSYTVRPKSGDATRIEIIDATASLTYLVPHAIVPSLTFNTGDGNDTLTITTASAPAIVFNGGTNAAFDDTLNVSAGVFSFNADAKLGTANLVLNVTSSSASVIFNTTQRIKALNLTAGAATMTLNGANVLSTQTISVTSGTLDMKDNDLLVHAGSVGTWNGSAYTGVSGLLAAGYNGLPGVKTSITTVPNGIAATTLGIAEASFLLGLGGSDTATWNGITIDADCVIVKFTYTGDVDLNGELNGDDYFYLDSNAAISGSIFGYTNGDIDLNGEINGDDYFWLDSNINAQGTPL